MKTIVVNGDFLVAKTFAGVGRFATETLRELDKIMPRNICFEIVCPEYTEKEMDLNNIKIIKYGRLNLQLWKLISLPYYVRKRKAYLLDFTQAFPLGVYSFTYIHDCIPEIYPQSYESFVKKIIRRPIKLMQRKMAAKNCTCLFTLTENSKKDILHYYHIPEKKVVVTYTGWEHITETKEDNNIINKIKDLKQGNYCFTLGSRVWHKNIKWVISAAKQNPNYKFVISGDNSYMKGFEKEMRSMPANIIFTGYISDGEVRALMAHCKAFLFPTLYEGFGMPPLEAMSVEAPIIISNASCLPEIYEDAAHYINPLEYENINIDRILAEPVSSSKKIMEKYSWNKTAVKVLNTILKTIKETKNESFIYNHA